MSITRRWPDRPTALWLAAIALLAILVAWELAGLTVDSEPQSDIQPHAAASPIPQPTSARQLIKTHLPHPATSSAQAQTTPLLQLDEAIKKARSEFAERCPALEPVQPPEYAAELPVSMQEASQASENSLRHCRKNISLANPFVSTRQ